MKIFKNWINGEWEEPQSGRWSENTCPSDQRRTIGKFPASAADDVDQAVKAAKRAFPAWSSLPAPKRADILRRTALILEKRKKELGLLVSTEMGKVLTEGAADIQEAVDTFDYYAGEGRRLFGETTPSELTAKVCFTRREPVGVAGLITPWNFPVAVPSWKIAPALICGNTVVLKPAEESPLCALRLAEILTQAGLPLGVLNIVMGKGEEAGRALVDHSDVNLISFTGSTETGHQVAENCARQLKTYALEMGGKNAQIVLEDANLDLALKGALWGSFATSGQRCTATSRLIIHEKVYHLFLNRFVTLAKKLKVGKAWDSKTTLGPLVSAAQLKRVTDYVKAGQEEGANILLGGSVLRKGAFQHGHYFQPTIFADVLPWMKIFREEIFGPVVSVVKVKSFEEAIMTANDSSFGLSTSLYTQDIVKAMRGVERLETGIVYVNSPTIGAEVHLPFGGIKDTGNGTREAGQTALDVFSRWKTVYIDYSGRLQRAQIDS